MDEREQFVGRHDFVRDLSGVEAHVFRTLHGCVHMHVASLRRGKDTVPYTF
jgi:hypothetical protein